MTPEVIWIYGGLVCSVVVVAFAAFTLLIWPFDDRR